MAIRKKSSRSRKKESTGNNANALSVTDNLGKLGCECQSKLLEITSEYAQVSNTETANLNRAMAEEQFAAQVACQEFWQNLSKAALQAGPADSSPQDLLKLNAAYAEQLESIQAASSQSLESARDQVSQSLAEGTEAANDQWDTTCSEFVESVQEVISQVDASDLNPQDLFSLGQSLIWISKHYRVTKQPE